MPKTSTTELDLAEVLAKTGSEEWQTAIASRLELMHGYLAQEAWTKGVTPYLSAIVGSGLRKFLRGKSTQADADYLRGFVAALELVLALPASVEGQINREESKGKQSGPTRYTDA